MAIRVYKVADIAGNHVVYSPQRKFRAGDLAAIITSLQQVEDPISESLWTFGLDIGEGPGARHVVIDLPPLIGKSVPLDVPLLLGERQDHVGDLSGGYSLFYFRGHLFMPERAPRDASEREEVTLRIKKAAYDEEFALSSLRAAVANLEAAIEFQKSGPKRDPIPEEVKLLVWARDGGCCVRCGSNQELHFDHIIPVAKGGGNSEANIQILCQPCNLRKADKIAIT
jgi:hypothetical protein